MGGIYGEPQQYFSFPGGQVIDITDVLTYINLFNLTHTVGNIPPLPFPSANLRWAFQVEIFFFFRGKIHFFFFFF
jgi:hypothetical protein